MATANPFDLLGDDDSEEPSLLIAAQKLKLAEQNKSEEANPQTKPTSQPKLPSKPLPPAQAAVKEAKSESARGVGRGGGHGHGYGRGRGASYRDSSHAENSHGDREIAPPQAASAETDRERPYERRGGYSGPRGGRRSEFSGNGQVFEGNRDRPRRPYERRSGTGRGSEIKREGSGRGNWGSQNDEVAPVVDRVVDEGDKNQPTEKPSGEEPAAAAAAADGDGETVKDGGEEKEAGDKEMTLEEYEKVLEEKRKGLQSLKTEERKVDAKEFEAMQQLSNKKTGDHIFIKLGSEKDRKKEVAEKEERAKKSVSINEFLKAGEGEKYYNNPSRGRGRGRGSRGGGNVGGVQAPSIEDPGEFPSLG
ncbi:hypothetical protein M569_02184 [Genlisea aurea]|uniref:Hyaluronan/mRNA-binding protein domain-containing protein n=1 Tax=Genlisea aurea TaxID=192259 RepID=S8CZT7_9LAMI|nr:hypothetical protein M569_02184 [Genlisea aurea]